VISNAKIAIGVFFSDSASYFFGNAQTFLVVLYGLLEFTKALVSTTEMSVGTSFSVLIVLLLGNA